MNKLASIFTQESKAAIFKFEKEGEVVRPVEYWSSAPSDSNILAACDRLTEGYEPGDYIALNGIFQDEQKGWQNPLQRRLGSLSKNVPIWLLEKDQEIALKAALEIAEVEGQLDISAFEEWPKIRTEIRSTEGLSVRSLAFLQGLSELISPVSKVSRPLWDVNIPVLGGMDIVNQINAFADTVDGGTTMY